MVNSYVCVLVFEVILVIKYFFVVKKVLETNNSMYAKLVTQSFLQQCVDSVAYNLHVRKTFFLATSAPLHVIKYYKVYKCIRVSMCECRREYDEVEHTSVTTSFIFVFLLLLMVFGLTSCEKKEKFPTQRDL